MSTFAFPLSFHGAEVLPTSPHLPLPARSTVLLAVGSQPRCRGWAATYPCPSGFAGWLGRALGSQAGEAGPRREELWSSGTCQGPRSLVPCTAAAELWCPSHQGPELVSSDPPLCPSTHRPCSPGSSSPPPCVTLCSSAGQSPSCIRQLTPPSRSAPSARPNKNSILDLLGASAPQLS